MRETKRDFIKNNLEINRLNPKKFWRTLNSILKPKASTGIDVQFFDKAKNTKVPVKDTCDFLNDFFANVGNRKAPIQAVFEEPIFEGNKLDLGDVREGEVKRLISEIDITKDSCIEGVSTNVLKFALSKIIKAMSYLFSMSLKWGIFPKKWAIGFISILPKGGDKTDPSNWRPITQTCVPAKLLEKIVQQRFMSHLNVNNILSECQYGFRKGRSTQQAIFELYKDLNYNLNKDNIIGILFLDISKAFDSLDHKLLLEKLLKVGLAPNSN